ncbi:MAG TPA: Fic family protein [Candidatus Sulfotelmatobacter sp.]|nr:Fic family protein [Candidatus Sulfotelmatobacter sp.]
MESVGQLTSRIDMLAALVRAAPPAAALRDVYAALRLEELVGSARLAGARLDQTEVRVLLDRGRALGGHPLEAYLTVRGYAEAAAWAVRRAARLAPITTEDLRTLHRLATRGLAEDPGVWRTRTVPPLPDGTVPPPHWLVTFETETYVGRLALDADAPAPLAVARALARLVRLQPFATGNGRVARLVANVLLARRRLPPLVLDARARRGYRAAVHEALGGDATPLARIVARSVIGGLERMRDAIEAPAGLAPLAELVAPEELQATYKAAQRGRLRVVRKEGRLLSTADWVAQARASRRVPTARRYR